MKPCPIPPSLWFQAGGFAAMTLLLVAAAVAWPSRASPLAAIYPAWISPEAAYVAALAIPGWRPMRVRAGLFPVIFLAPEASASVMAAWRSGHALVIVSADGAYGCAPGTDGS